MKAFRDTDEVGSPIPEVSASVITGSRIVASAPHTREGLRLIRARSPTYLRVFLEDLRKFRDELVMMAIALLVGAVAAILLLCLLSVALPRPRPSLVATSVPPCISTNRRDIETNAKSRVLAIGVPSHSREHLEDSIQCLTCDSDPGIGYVDS